jgi:hypothetical protein
MASYYKLKNMRNNIRIMIQKGNQKKKQHQQKDKCFSLTLKSTIPFNETRIVVFTLEVVPPVV